MIERFPVFRRLMQHDGTDGLPDAACRNDMRVSLFHAVLLHGLIAVSVFSPLLFRGLLPVWSTDNFYGSYPFLAVSRESFWQGWSAWLPYSQSGVDFAGNVTNLSYSPLLLPLFLMPENWLWPGFGVVQFLLYWGVGVLFFLVARREVASPGWALFAATAYQLSTSLLLTLQAFPMICVVVFLLLCLYVVSRLDELPPAPALLYLALSFTGLLLSGHYVQTTYAGLFVGLYFLHRHGFRPRDLARLDSPTALLVMASASAVLLCLFRILPIAASMQDSSRLATAIVANHAARPHALLQLVFPEIFGITVYDPLGLAATASQFGGGSNSYFVFPGSLVGVLNQCGIVVMVLVLMGIFSRRSQGDGSAFWKYLSIFCLACIASIWPIPFIANLLVHPFQHGSFLRIVIPIAFCILAARTGAGLVSRLRSGRAADFWRPGLCLALAATYTVMMFSFAWQNHQFGVLMARGAILLPILAAALAYGLRNDRQWAGITSTLARVVPWFIAAVIAVFFVGATAYLAGSGSMVPGVLFRRALWLQGGMVAVLASLLYWVRGRGKGVVAVVVLGGCMVMSWPWYLSGDSLRMVSMALTKQESYLLAGLGASLATMIFAVIWASARSVQQGCLNGNAFLVVCLVLSTGHSLVVWKEMDALSSQPFVRLLQDGSILAPRPVYRELDLRNFRVGFPHGAFQPRSDFLPEGVEPLSNLPLLGKIPTYGGLNGHFSQIDKVFFNTLSGVKDGKLGLPTDATNDRFLDLAGVRYDFRHGVMKERGSALARIMLYGAARVEKDMNRQLELLSGPEFNPVSEVLVDTAVTRTDSAQGARMLQYESLSNDRIRVDVSGSGGGVLLFNDTWSPGWKAKIDGRAVPVMRANFKAMAVDVPPSVRLVEFHYHSARGGGLAGAIAGCAILGLSVFRLLQMRRRSDVSA